MGGWPLMQCTTAWKCTGEYGWVGCGQPDNCTCYHGVIVQQSTAPHLFWRDRSWRLSSLTAGPSGPPGPAGTPGASRQCSRAAMLHIVMSSHSGMVFADELHAGATACSYGHPQ
jgi:hypothetical protein